MSAFGPDGEEDATSAAVCLVDDRLGYRSPRIDGRVYDLGSILPRHPAAAVRVGGHDSGAVVAVGPPACVVARALGARGRPPARSPPPPVPRATERGASMTEFVIVAPVLLLLGLGTVQAGLVYHGRTVLNYATFEAARAGATRHARPGPMRRELGARLAPLFGGEGSDAKAAMAIGRGLLEAESPLTRLAILNPTPASFVAWGSAPTRWRVRCPEGRGRRGRG